MTRLLCDQGQVSTITRSRNAVGEEGGWWDEEEKRQRSWEFERQVWTSPMTRAGTDKPTRGGALLSRCRRCKRQRRTTMGLPVRRSFSFDYLCCLTLFVLRHTHAYTCTRIHNTNAVKSCIHINLRENVFVMLKRCRHWRDIILSRVMCLHRFRYSSSPLSQFYPSLLARSTSRAKREPFTTVKHRRAHGTMKLARH